MERISCGRLQYRSFISTESQVAVLNEGCNPTPAQAQLARRPDGRAVPGGFTVSGGMGGGGRQLRPA